MQSCAARASNIGPAPQPRITWVLSNSVENERLCHVIPGTKLGVEHMASQSQNDLSLLTRIQSHRTRNETLSRHASCEPLDLKSFRQQHIDSWRECFQLAQRSRERSGTIDLVFALLAEVLNTPHPSDAGSPATCKVHGHPAESQSNSCCLEQFCCGRVIEIPDGLYQIFHTLVVARSW